MPDSHMRCL